MIAERRMQNGGANERLGLTRKLNTDLRENRFTEPPSSLHLKPRASSSGLHSMPPAPSLKPFSFLPLNLSPSLYKPVDYRGFKHWAKDQNAAFCGNLRDHRGHLQR